MQPIESFTDQYRFLSNFFPSPFEWSQRIWPTVEHAFQAAKSLNQGEQELIRSCPTPGKAKRAGKKVLLRPDWEEVKFEVMLELVRLKFQHNLDLAAKLLATGEAELIEGNLWHDNIWGKCCCEQCAETAGENLLGRILMQVRQELQQNDDPDQKSVDE